jgi:hypothetical protein
MDTNANDNSKLKDLNKTLHAFNIRCKVKDIGLNSFLLCLEDNPKLCVYSLSYGDSYFCKCPLLCASVNKKVDEQLMVKQRRRHQRIKVDLPLVYTYSNEHGVTTKAGKTFDLSDSGMGFYTETPLHEGLDLKITINHISHSPRDSNVKWCNMINPNLYKVGVSFQQKAT